MNHLGLLGPGNGAHATAARRALWPVGRLSATNTAEVAVRMAANGTNGWLRTSGPPLKRVVWIFAAILCGAVAAPAQQNGQLEEELQQLRQQYDQTTRDLQQRISALEQQ